jgi:hypothetical protein
MRNLIQVCSILGMFVLPAFSAPKQNARQSAANSIVIVFKDGHQQAFPMSDIARIEFNSGASGSDATLVGVNRFLGRWTVGEGNGSGSTFTINLKRNGVAEKSLGATHGTWMVVDGEARISWDDGWKDVIRRAGEKYEKVAHAPGTSFSDRSDNITDARREDPQPI